MRSEIIKKIEEEKVIAIVRGIDPEKSIGVAKALYEGGIRLIEVTFAHNKPETFKDTKNSIEEISKMFDGKIEVGAGTVLMPEQVDMAVEAGAKYIISPDVNADVIKRTLERGLVSLPGALTPSEIVKAHNLGADFVKVFPASSLGAGYFKAVKAPLSHIKLLAVGGINEDNAADYLSAGAVGLGVGGNLVNAKHIENGEYSKLTETANKLMYAINQS